MDGHIISSNYRQQGRTNLDPSANKVIYKLSFWLKNMKRLNIVVSIYGISENTVADVTIWDPAQGYLLTWAGFFPDSCPQGQPLSLLVGVTPHFLLPLQLKAPPPPPRPFKVISLSTTGSGWPKFISGMDRRRSALKSRVFFECVNDGCVATRKLVHIWG